MPDAFDKLAATKRKHAGQRRPVPILIHRNLSSVVRIPVVTGTHGIVPPGGSSTPSQSPSTPRRRLAATTSIGSTDRCMPAWLSVATGCWHLACTEGCWDGPRAPDLSTCRDNLTNPVAPIINPGEGGIEIPPSPPSARSYLATQMKNKKFRQMYVKRRK